MITNFPPILDETGQMMKAALLKRNSLLSMIAEGKRQDVYSDISQIASIVRNGTLSQNAKTFPIGDQIIVPWKDMDSSNHNTDETAYQAVLNIVHHGMVELEDGETVPGMFLQWHYCSPYGVQLSNFQAFYKAEAGLSAGTYSVQMANKWGNYGLDAGSMWYFTLTQDVPEGGMLSGFETMADGTVDRFRVKSWASQTATSPIETVVVTGEAPSETTVTHLGVLNYTTKSPDGLNCMQSVGYGHNRWKTSALRQYLNSSGENWWHPQEEFDLRPNEYAKKGFMAGFSADFLAATKPIKIGTALNTVEGFEDTVDETFDRFFVPSLEQMYVNPQLRGVEGEYFEYWKRRIGRTTPFPQGGTDTRYKHFGIENKAASQSVRLRSANRGYANNTWYVSSSGYVYGNSGGAYYALRFSPVCVIC